MYMRIFIVELRTPAMLLGTGVTGRKAVVVVVVAAAAGVVVVVVVAVAVAVAVAVVVAGGNRAYCRSLVNP